MTPDDYDALEAEAADESAFANGDESYPWFAANCGTCIHDKPAREGRDGDGCPLILIALIGKRPAQWLDGPRTPEGLFARATQYVCTEQRGEEEPDPTPRPIPDLPGQGVLLPREPYTGHRMLTALPEHTETPA
ncbi:hypothetical protein [Embleya sp. NPDC005971]|uniref:hypothetical protein n=1 Tax=Embleya sp. NPDC005971 TaxID=3156724 RepID=UPI0033F2D05C